MDPLSSPPTTKEQQQINCFGFCKVEINQNINGVEVNTTMGKACATYSRFKSVLIHESTARPEIRTAFSPAGASPYEASQLFKDNQRRACSWSH